jgi:predicted metal-dependent enzyme (double-stranded beta helix superfamily)
MGAGVDRPVRELFERIAEAAAGDPPDMAAIGAALVDLASDRDYVTPWVRRLGEAGGSLPIHAPGDGPRLTIVRRPEGHLSAVHDHGTWVAISPIAGREIHRRYRIVGGDPAVLPSLLEVRALGPRDVLTLLNPDDIHDHGHVAGEGIPAHVLILTGTDQTQLTRNEWDVATGRHRRLRPGDSGRWLASEPLPSR